MEAARHRLALDRRRHCSLFEEAKQNARSKNRRGAHASAEKQRAPAHSERGGERLFSSKRQRRRLWPLLLARVAAVASVTSAEFGSVDEKIGWGARRGRALSRGNGFWGAERKSSLKLTSTPLFCSLGKNNFRKKRLKKTVGKLDGSRFNGS
jgi:hypothetical protein